MRNRKGNARGFTLIEVLISAIVFMIAMFGLIALQRASISAANVGREQTAAVNIARFVMTSLEGEAAAWPLAVSGAIPAPTAGLPMLNKGLTTPDAWVTLPNVGATTRLDAYLEPSTSPLYAGTDAVDSAPYCVGYRVLPLGADEDPVAYQVWVRVTWPRWGQYKPSSSSPNWKDCGTRISDAAVTQGTLQVVEMTGVVTREFTSRWTEDT